MLGLNLNCCFEPSDAPFDLILRKVPISEMQWGSGLPPASVVGVLDPLQVLTLSLLPVQ